MMVSQAAHRHFLTEKVAEDLKEFAELRNAIVHSEYDDELRPIADPLPETIETIERYRDLLTHPPLALSVLGHHQKVITFSPDDDIREVLKVLRTSPISQFPIYSEGRAVDLLTTNTIARWVAADLDDNDHLDAKTVQEVLTFAESNDRAVFLPRDITAQHALEAMLTPLNNGSLPRAGLITEHGKNTQKPIRVIGGSDVATLWNAVE